MEAPKVNYVRHCKLHRVIDGDTVEVLVDLGFKRYSRERVRIGGIDAPEQIGLSRHLGKEASAYVRWWFDPQGTYILDSFKADSFGRWLGDIWRIDTPEPLSLSQSLLNSNHAEAWPPQEK